MQPTVGCKTLAKTLPQGTQNGPRLLKKERQRLFSPKGQKPGQNLRTTCSNSPSTLAKERATAIQLYVVKTSWTSLKIR